MFKTIRSIFSFFVIFFLFLGFVNGVFGEERTAEFECEVGFDKNYEIEYDSQTNMITDISPRPDKGDLENIQNAYGGEFKIGGDVFEFTRNLMTNGNQRLSSFLDGSNVKFENGLRYEVGDDPSKLSSKSIKKQSEFVPPEGMEVGDEGELTITQGKLRIADLETRVNKDGEPVVVVEEEEKLIDDFIENIDEYDYLEETKVVLVYELMKEKKRIEEANPSSNQKEVKSGSKSKTGEDEGKSDTSIQYSDSVPVTATQNQPLTPESNMDDLIVTCKTGENCPKSGTYGGVEYSIKKDGEYVYLTTGEGDSEVKYRVDNNNNVQSAVRVFEEGNTIVDQYEDFGTLDDLKNGESSIIDEQFIKRFLIMFEEKEMDDLDKLSSNKKTELDIAKNLRLKKIAEENKKKYNGRILEDNQIENLDKEGLIFITQVGDEESKSAALNKFMERLDNPNTKEEYIEALKKTDKGFYRSYLENKHLQEYKTSENNDDYLNTFGNNYRVLYDANPEAFKQAMIEVASTDSQYQYVAQNFLMNNKEMLEEDDLYFLVGAYTQTGNVEDYDELAKVVKGTDCDSFLGSIWCTVTDRKNTRQEFENFVRSDIIASSLFESSEIDDGGIEISEESKILGFFGNDRKGGKICEGVNTKKDCLSDPKYYEKFCDDNGLEGSSCINVIEDFIDKNTKINTGAFNKKIYEDFSVKYGLKGCTDYNDCKQAVETRCEDVDDETCNNLKAGLTIIQDNTYVETNALYSFMAILKGDQNAKDAAKFFGAEADYSELPKWLGDDVATSICYSKIDGYYDKELENDGGVTKYGCTEEDPLDEGRNQYCLEVIVDLRAKRTEITPDNMTAVTYSYFLRAPEDEDLRYIVALSYKDDERVHRFVIEENQSLEEGGVASEFDTVVVNVTSQNAQSFVIGLAAFYEDDHDVYEKTTVPIIPAKPEVYEPGTVIEREESQTDETVEDALSTENMLEELYGN